MGRLNDIFAGAVLVAGCHAVFEIKINHIRGTCCHFLKESDSRAGAEQLAAIGARDRRGLQAK